MHDHLDAAGVTLLPAPAPPAPPSDQILCFLRLVLDLTDRAHLLAPLRNSAIPIYDIQFPAKRLGGQGGKFKWLNVNGDELGTRVT